MKRYLMGIAALVLAIGFTAFTNRPMANVTLTFTGSPSDQSQVENENLWQEGTTSCPSGNNKSCTMEVDINYTKLLPPANVIRVLDVADIVLGSVAHNVGGTDYYTPTQASGSGSFVATNKN